MTLRWQITVTEVDVSGDGGPELPEANWDVPAISAPENVSGTGPPYAVEIKVKLTNPATGEPQAAPSPNVLIPFTLGGTASIGQGQDYWFTANENNSNGLPEYDARFIRINGGNTEGQIWVYVNPDSVDEGDETITLTMAQSSTYQDVTVDLTNCTIGAQSLHTFTIVDDDAVGNPQLFFEQAGGTVTETDGDQTYSFDIRLSSPAPAGGVGADVIQTGGTAVDPTDYTGLPIIGAPLIAEGLQSRQLQITVKGDTAVTGDRNLIMGFDNVTNATVGGQATHELTIEEDDETLFDTGTVGFLNPAQDSVVEGQVINLRLAYDGGAPHTPFTVEWVHDGVVDGRSGKAADKGGADRDYAALVQPPLTFGSDETVKTIPVQAIQDALVEDSEDFRFTLTQITGPAGVTIGARDDVTVTIVDEPPPPTSGLDGDLTDYEGNRVATERQPVDFDDPHMIVSAGSTSESVEVTATGAAILGISAGSYAPTNGSGVHRAIEFAEQGWMSLHGPTGSENQYANTAAVPIGFELTPIRIQVNTRSWVDSNLFDSYTYNIQAGNGTSGTYKWLDGDPNESSMWVQPGNTVIRDLCIYSERPASEAPRSVTFTQQEFGGGTNGVVDNLRFDRITFTNSFSSGNGSAIKIVGTQSGVASPGSNVPHGRLHFHDCRVGGHPGRYAEGTRPERTIRCAMAAWDFRESIPQLWPSWYAADEYPLYNDMVVGPETYPNLDYRWLPADDPRGSVPTTGFHANALAANTFINMHEEPREPPWHPAATNTGPGGTKQGPFAASGSGMIQLTNRPNYGPDADMSSGLMLFLRVVGGGADVNNSGDMLKIWSHNGTVYYKDCECRGHPSFSNGAHGFIRMEQDYSGNSSSGPQGRYRIGNTGSPATDRTYATGRVIVDGGIASANSKKKMLTFAGVQHIELRGPINIVEWSGGRPQFTLGEDANQPGDLFTETLDYSGLIVPSTGLPYDGPLSTFPGWYLGLLTAQDNYFLNWLGNEANERNPITQADIDNLATSGPPSYSQANGLIKQQFDNRLNLGTITPSWSPSAYGASSSPKIPDVFIENPGETLGEDELELTSSVSRTIDVTTSGTSMCAILIYRSFSLIGVANVTVEDGFQNSWPEPEPAWTAPSGQFFEMKPMGGRGLGSGTNPGTSSDSPQLGPDSHQSDFWGNKHDPAYFRVRKTTASAWTTGSKSLTFLLDNGGTTPRWEYPVGSGTFVATDGSGAQGSTVTLIPSVDNPEVWLAGAAAIQIELATWVDGDTVFRSFVRDAVANLDAIQLRSTMPVSKQITSPGGGDVELNAPVTFFPGATVAGFNITIPTTDPDTGQPTWAVGDTALLTLDYASGINVAAPTSGQAQSLFIEFI